MIMKKLSDLHNKIDQAYAEYDAAVKKEFPPGTVIKSSILGGVVGLVLKNEGRFGLTILAENGHQVGVFGDGVEKVDIKDIPSNTRKRLLLYKYHQRGCLDWDELERVYRSFRTVDY
jgi:hypothetical protein